MISGQWSEDSDQWLQSASRSEAEIPQKAGLQVQLTLDLGLWTSDIKEKMVIGTVFKGVLDEAKGEAKKKETSPYWVMCPSCARQVVKKELLNKGCYVCSWQGTEAELREAQTKTLDQRGSQSPYRSNCSNCGAKVITQELREKGCYICGWKDI